MRSSFGSRWGEGGFIGKRGREACGQGTVNILPHPGWVSWLETRHPLLLVWKDLAIKWVGRQLRVTRGQRDRHSYRWSRFESAMLMETCSDLRAVAESWREDRLIWLDQLHYAHTIGPLRVAERAWRKVQRQQRRKVLLDAVPQSP